MFDIFNKHFFKKSSHVRKNYHEEMWSDVLLKPQDGALPDSKKLFGGSTTLLLVIATVLVSAVCVRIIYLQAFASEEYDELAYNNHVRTYTTRSLRGVVYDANDTLLVENIPRDDVAIVPADLPRNRDERDDVLRTLALILDVSQSEIEGPIKNHEFLYSPITVSEDVPHEKKLEILLTFPDKKNGVVMVPNFYRNYLTEKEMSFIMGYMGKITRDEWLEKNDSYTFNSEIGKEGLEKSYEDILRGRNGEQIINVDAAGRLRNVLATSEPQSGCDLKLTIDTRLQSEVTKMLQNTLKATDTSAGVVIIQDPNTGAIITMTSLPTFDNTVMTNGIVGEEEIAQFNEWIEDENTPFLHRAISGVYPPGSTYKLVTASAALQSGTVSVGDYIDSPGQIVIPSWFDPEQTFIYKDWKAAGHGYLNIEGALAQSSDTFFYKVTGGFEQRIGMGESVLNEYAKMYGIGEKLGIDLPQESAGTLPNEAWKREKIGENWYVGDTYNMSIGQGYLLTTPLHVSNFTNIVANGGTYYKPYVVGEVMNCDLGGIVEPQVIRENFVDAEHIQTVQDGLRLSITSDNGTAKALRNLSVPIAGKTGTAQFNNNEQEHAWFSAYAPYNNPEITVTVLIEGGGEGSSVAAPLAGRIIEFYFSEKSADNE